MESPNSEKHLVWFNEYTGMHYGAHYLQKRWKKFISVENFECVAKLSKLTIDAVDEACTNTRALDIGCCVGGVTFKLAAKFKNVIGVDCSQKFIQFCDKLKKNGKTTIYSCEEGDLVTEMMAEIPESIDRSRCSFLVRDVNDLPRGIGTFGCVVASNVLDSLENPLQVLKMLPSLLDDHGICVIACHHYFLEDFTPKENWLGGYLNEDGQAVTASNKIKEVLCKEMKLVETAEIPFLVQVRSRLLHLYISEVQVWKKLPNV